MKTLLSVVLSSAFLTGCASSMYKKPTNTLINCYQKHPATTEIARKTREEALEHEIYSVIPFQIEQMYPFDPRYLTWYLFGNDEDGVFGEGIAEGNPYSSDINYKTFIRWNFLRNPMHNFKYYPPLGSACLKKHWNLSIVRYDKNGFGVFRNDKTGVFGAGKNAFKINLNDLKPLVSLKLGNFETYFGWREKGNFGTSFRYHRKKEEKK